ncbi:MAG: hypothetical protein F4X57_13850 [Chloroflexi bacterium]|nr:hypothetical protein [Chloroflexota bacterium]
MLLHIMRNTLSTATTLARTIFDDLSGRLPPRWTLHDCTRFDGFDSPRSDATWEIQDPRGASSLVVVEVKVNPSQPNYINFISGQLLQLADSLNDRRRYYDTDPIPLLISSFLSPLARERLDANGISYADSTGNVRFVSENPAIFIETHGADRNPFREKRSLRSLRGGRAGRIVRAFLDYRAPFGTREIAAETQNSPSTVSRVADLLERDAIIIREGPRGRIVSVDWETLSRRWAMDYEFTRSNTPTTWLEPRGTRALLERLRFTDFRYAVTGSFAAYRLAPVAVPRLLTLYTEDPEADALALGLRPADTGGNVLIVRPFDPVVFERTQHEDGITYARVTQVLVDLMTGTGRSPVEADGLLEWMRINEEAWKLWISSRT